jgi:hypothetical protein
MTLLTALAARLGRALAVLGEVAGIARGATATMAALATFSSRFGRALTIVREISRTALSTQMAGARRLLAVFGKIARVPGMPVLAHHTLPLSSSDGMPSPLQRG